jgi:hypothetical protein
MKSKGNVYKNKRQLVDAIHKLKAEASRTKNLNDQMEVRRVKCVAFLFCHSEAKAACAGTRRCANAVPADLQRSVVPLLRSSTRTPTSSTLLARRMLDCIGFDSSGSLSTLERLFRTSVICKASPCILREKLQLTPQFSIWPHHLVEIL